MRSIITYWWVYVFLLISYSGNAQHSLFAHADSLLTARLFEEASLGFESILWENENDHDEIFVANVLLKKTACLKELRRFDRVESLLGRINIPNLPDSMQFYIYYERALAAFLTENFELAEKNILPVFNLSLTDNEKIYAATLLHVIILNEMGRWSEARQQLVNYYQHQTVLNENEKEAKLKDVENLYNAEMIPKLKRIKKSKTLSLLFPGAGQAYNEDYGRGLVSLSFVSLAGLYIGYNIINTTYLTAASAGVYLFLYFYFGGANQANYRVPLKNYPKKKNYNDYLKKNIIALHASYTNKP